MAGKQAALALAVACAGLAQAQSLHPAAPFPARALTTREAIVRIEQVYAPQGGFYDFARIETNTLCLYADAARTGAPVCEIEFAPDELAVIPRSVLATFSPESNAPLRGLRIALDPGHIGGEWARMEERFFVPDRSRWFVQEGAMNLYVCRLIRDQLQAMGADVAMTKDDLDPVTRMRPDDFRADAEREIGSASDRFTNLPELFREAARADAVRKRRELLFYRAAEIEARARRLNEEILPDLTICVHFNARDVEGGFDLIEDNGLMVFVHGCYRPDELQDPAQRMRLVEKLMEGSHELELGVAEAIAESLERATGIPGTFMEDGGIVQHVGRVPFVYARNLAANRQFNGPVIFLEPYYMNNRIVYERIQLGDYDGVREMEGVAYRSIFREYADAVVAGLTNYFAGR